MSGKKSKKITDEEFLELCEEGTTEEILAAIKAGANVNAEGGPWSQAPMTLCIRRREPELVLALVDAGADVNMWVEDMTEDLGDETSFNISALTPLATAVLLGMNDLVKPLLDRGADPDTWVCRHHLNTDLCVFSEFVEFVDGPLLCFITFKGCYEYKETVKLLLEAGADINALDARGRTPLRVALENMEGNEDFDTDDIIEIANFLLELGADVRKLGERQNRTLFELAMEQGPKWEVGEWEPETYSDMFEYLLHIGADVNEQDRSGRTALMWAVRERKFEYVLKLLEAGADVNLRDDKGRTALIYLYGFNYAHYFDPDQRPDDTHVLDIIDALTGAGAGGAEADEDGMTALMYAAEKTTTPEVLTALLGAGSDPAARDKLGLYAYDYAMKNEALRGTVDFAFLTFSALEKAARKTK